LCFVTGIPDELADQV